MKAGFTILSKAGLLMSMLCLSTIEGLAMPMPILAAPTTGTFAVEHVRCPCAVRRHREHRGYVGPAVSDPYIFPAPPVGVTLRKIFGLGYL